MAIPGHHAIWHLLGETRMAQSSAIRRCGTLGQSRREGLITPDLAMRARGLLEPRSNDCNGQKVGPQNAREARQLVVARSGAERAREHQSSSPEPLLGLPFIDDDAKSIVDKKARPGAASHGCDISGVLAVNMERPFGPGVRTSGPDATHALTRRDLVDRLEPQERAELVQSAGLKRARSPIVLSVPPAARRRGQATRLHLGAALQDRGIDRRANSASL
jgi:hypothetical protein